MKKIIFAFSVLISIISFGQNINFIKSYGNNGYDYGRDIKQDIDTGYIATGSSSSFGNETADAFLLKVDSVGEFIWSYNYGGQDTDWGESVVITSDDSYAIGGFTNSFGNGGFDFYLVRTDANGVPLWEKTYGGSDWDRAHSIVQLADSGFVLVGETYSYGNGNSDIYMVRTNKNGDTLWTRTYGGTENDYGNSVVLDGDSLVVAGGTESFGAGMSDGIILKYHIDGSLGWVKTAGMEKNDYFTSIISNNSGEYFLSGSRLYYYDQTGYLDDFWIYNISDDGNTLLSDTTMSGGSHEVEIAYDIAVDATDNIFYGGSTKSFGSALLDGKTDAFMGKLLNNYYTGTYLQSFGSGGDDDIRALDYCYDKGIVGVGNLKYNSSGGNNVIIVKVDRTNSEGVISVIQDLVTDSITLSFEELIIATELKVYPTIFENTITIEGLPSGSIVKVYGNSGQLMYSSNISSPYFDLNFLASGFYILKIETENSIVTHKIIKR
jgi:hypothetical protein